MAARKKSEEPSINIDEVLTDEELKAVANESEPAERKAKPEDGPRTVVVAEDEAVNRMDLVAMLEDNGYEVVGQAANGEEAVELTRKYRPDVVCMDVKMPRMDMARTPIERRKSQYDSSCAQWQGMLRDLRARQQ